MAEQGGARNDAREREQRLQALSDLARQSGQAPTPAPATSAPPAPPAPAQRAKPARRGRLPTLIGVVALVAVVAVVAAGALAYLRPQASTTKQPTVPSQLVVDFAAQHLGCAQDAAWSPDGARLAVLGYNGDCPVPDPMANRYAAGLLNIYPSQTGKKPLQLQPDDLINEVLHLPMSQTLSAPSNSQPVETKTPIQYNRLLWSRDGKRLALPFTVDIITNIRPDHYGGTTWDNTLITGVLLMDADGSHPRAFSHTLGKSDLLNGQWDLSTGTYTSGTRLTTGPYGNLPPALAYAWDAGGKLQPQAPLTGATPPPAPPLAPIGDPAQDASFTIWQPAMMGPVTLYIGVPPNERSFTLPGTYSYAFNLTAWSPDGRYLWTSPASQWFLRDPSQPAPNAGQLALAAKYHVGSPLLPVRDQALSAVLAAHPIGSLGVGTVPNAFAWSPNGKRLAVTRILPDDSGSHVVLPGHYVVDIYDCATGQRLASLTPALRIASSSYSMSTTLLRWSRDGSRLLIYDTVLDEATIWGPGKLPAK